MKKKGMIFSIILGVVLLIEIFALAFLAFKIYGTKQYQERLDLGNKYLLDLDYENAELCYLKAIEIDEKKVTPYINLSYLYIETEQFEAAYEILEQAQEVVSEDDIETIEAQKGKVADAWALSEVAAENQEEMADSEEPNFVQSGVMQEYKGAIYTVYRVNADAGMVHIPDGEYISVLAVYKDHIYYTSPGGTGIEATEIYRTNLDGTDKTVIVTDAQAYDTFCIYNDILYYDAYYTGGNQSRSIDLNTLQINVEEYHFIEGSENAWIVSTESWGDEQYVSYPGYENIQPLPASSQATEYGVLGMYGEDVYYLSDANIVKVSASSVAAETVVVGEIVKTSYQPRILGDGLYYQTTEDEYLHRYDLKTGVAKFYNITDMIYEWGWWLTDEINGNLYFEMYIGENPEINYENTEFRELNLETGNARSIGRWFES